MIQSFLYVMQRLQVAKPIFIKLKIPVINMSRIFITIVINLNLPWLFSDITLAAILILLDVDHSRLAIFKTEFLISGQFVSDIVKRRAVMLQIVAFEADVADS